MAVLSKAITAYERMSEHIEAKHRSRYPLVRTDVSVELPGLSSSPSWRCTTTRSMR